MPSRSPSAAPRTRTNPEPSEHGPGISALTDTWRTVPNASNHMPPIIPDQVLSLLDRAHHPVAVSQQLTPPPADDTGEILADRHRLLCLVKGLLVPISAMAGRHE